MGTGAGTPVCPQEAKMDVVTKITIDQSTNWTNYLTNRTVINCSLSRTSKSDWNQD